MLKQQIVSPLKPAPSQRSPFRQSLAHLDNPPFSFEQIQGLLGDQATSIQKFQQVVNDLVLGH
ncbi:MAG: hypothetical protein OEV01_08465 [Nitrospira sp.]|nr:hypothetical protein [Nitrospira sp.]